MKKLILGSIKFITKSMVTFSEEDDKKIHGWWMTNWTWENSIGSWIDNYLMFLIYAGNK